MDESPFGPPPDVGPGLPVPDLGLGPAPPPVAPMAAPPTLQSFLPQQGAASKYAPLAILAAALLGGKKMNGLAQGYTQSQHQMGQEDLQKAQLMQQDAFRAQQFQQQQQHQADVMAQQEEARRMQALNTIKANVAKIRTLLGAEAPAQDDAPGAESIPLTLREPCPDCGG
jgi:uncharacterized protein HemX